MHLCWSIVGHGRDGKLLAHKPRQVIESRNADRVDAKASEEMRKGLYTT